MSNIRPSLAFLFVIYLSLLCSPQIGAQSISPDGTMVVFNKHDGTVWIRRIGDQAGPKQIADASHGWSFGSQFQWSPDNNAVAFEAFRGLRERNITPSLAIWHVVDKRARILNEAVFRLDPPPIRLLNGDTVLCATEPSSKGVDSQTVAIESWRALDAGKGPTVSVLESGGSLSGSLWRVDLDLIQPRRSESVNVGALDGFSVSPEHRYVALLRQKGALEESIKAIQMRVPIPHTLEIRRIDESMRTSTELSFDIRTPFPSPDEKWAVWSSDGKALAIATIPDVENSESKLWFRCSISERGCRPITTDEPLGTISDVVWSAGNDPIVRASKKENSQRGNVETRRDWWLVGEGGRIKNLTEAFTTPPDRLLTEGNGASFVAVSENQLWRIRPDKSNRERIGHPIGNNLGLVWPGQEDDPPERNLSAVILSSNNDGVLNLYRIRLSTGATTRIRQPAGNAEFAGYSPRSDTVLFERDISSLPYQIWACRASPAHCSVVVSTPRGNGARTEQAEVENVRGAKSVEVTYTSLKGESLTGLLYLPTSHKEGSLFPLVVCVYPGNLFPNFSCYGSGNLLDHGYAVLLPSMPLAPTGQGSDPYQEMLNGVIPAIDKVIEMRIADPNRVGLIGQSYGGYGVYSIITQSNRFQAAVAMSGYSDLASGYGTFDPRLRYTPLFTFGGAVSSFEYGQGRMGSLPWTDPQRYVRNSPIFYADRVKTPIMIIQGDMDFLPIQQGEEFFTALRRLNKRAKFVRYWGEGHVISSPVNSHDMWEQVYAWFDEFLKSGTRTEGQSKILQQSDIN